MFTLLAISLAGCSDGGTAPVATAVSGRYLVACPASAGAPAYGTLTFTTVENGVTTDHAATGAEINLDLAADGATAGRLFIPDAPDGSGGTMDFEADLAGTWTVAGEVLTLHHAADTFLRDMPLTVRDGQLIGDRTFGGVRVRLTLARR
jgi:hypothetical protein